MRSNRRFFEGLMRAFSIVGWSTFSKDLFSRLRYQVTSLVGATRLPAIIWQLIIATMIYRLAMFMTLPFVAIYLPKHFGTSPLITGLVAATGPLIATIAGFWGGAFSDILGRKMLVYVAMTLQTAGCMLFVFVDSVLGITLACALMGLGRSICDPILQAVLVDLVPPERRTFAIHARYTAINIGSAVGPVLVAVLSVSFGELALRASFIFASVAMVIYQFFVSNIVRNLPNEAVRNSTLNISSILSTVKGDSSLKYLILGGSVFLLGYCQIETTLAMTLQMLFDNGLQVYSTLHLINSIMIVFAQAPVQFMVRSWPTRWILCSGSILAACGLVGFGLASTFSGMVASMVLLTLGEILVFPNMMIALDRLAPPGLKGSYFGASSLCQSGYIFGPLLGGFIYEKFNVGYTFGVMAFLVLLTGIAFNASMRRST